MIAATPTPVHAAVASPVTITNRSLKVDSRRRIRVHVFCPKESGSCTGRLIIRTGSRRLGRSHFAIAGGATKTVTVRVSRSAFAKLGRSTGVTAIAFSRDAHGVNTQMRRLMTLKKS